MFCRRRLSLAIGACFLVYLFPSDLYAAAAQTARCGSRRGETSGLFQGRRPGGRHAAGEDGLKIRPLLVDGLVKEWTTARPTT